MITLIKTGLYFYLAHYIVNNIGSYIDKFDNPLLKYMFDNPLVKYMKFTKKIDKQLLVLILVIVFFNIY